MVVCGSGNRFPLPVNIDYDILGADGHIVNLGLHLLQALGMLVMGSCVHGQRRIGELGV